MSDPGLGHLSIRQLEARMVAIKDEAAAIRAELERRRDAKRYAHAGRASRRTRERARRENGGAQSDG